MAKTYAASEVDEIYVIVNAGLSSKILQETKKCEIECVTVILGKGTVSNKIANFLGITDTKKEIIKIVCDRKKAEELLLNLNDKYDFYKPNHGIAFTIEGRGVDTMYQAINVIVDRGNAELVIDAATKAGSKGGTIMHGRGSGINQTSKVFGIDIEPEKEIVLILSKVDQTKEIVDAISEELEIEEPGKGIIYIQDVNKTFGLYE